MILMWELPLHTICKETKHNMFWIRDDDDNIWFWIDWGIWLVNMTWHHTGSHLSTHFSLNFQFSEQCYILKITAHGSCVSCIIIYVQIFILGVELVFVFYVRNFRFMCHLSHSPIQWLLCDMTPEPVPEPVLS